MNDRAWMYTCSERGSWQVIRCSYMITFSTIFLTLRSAVGLIVGATALSEVPACRNAYINQWFCDFFAIIKRRITNSCLGRSRKCIVHCQFGHLQRSFQKLSGVPGHTTSLRFGPSLSSVDNTCRPGTMTTLRLCTRYTTWVLCKDLDCSGKEFECDCVQTVFEPTGSLYCFDVALAHYDIAPAVWPSKIIE